MSKYINADRLKAMMQPEYNRNKAVFNKTGERYVEGIMDGLDIVEQFIESLQQEQPMTLDDIREIIRIHRDVLSENPDRIMGSEENYEETLKRSLEYNENWE